MKPDPNHFAHPDDYSQALKTHRAEILGERVTDAVRAFRLLTETTGRTSLETLLNTPGHETAKGRLSHG